MTVYGEVSWSDDVAGDKKLVNNKDLWLRLEKGSNEIRLVTAPFQYLVHKYKKEGDPGFGQKVSCSIVHGSCPLCSIGDKAKPRWLLGVISRKSGTYKILDISYAVFSQIRKLAKNTQRWGDPTKYDVDVIVSPNEGPTGYYTVQPLSKEPLSAADQKIKDDADLEDLKRRSTPMEPAMVQKRIDKINGATFETNGSKSAVSTPVPTPVSAPKAFPVSLASDDAEDEMDAGFPDYNAS